MDAVDLVCPTEIEHLVDEVWVGDQLTQRYNFLDYHFEAGAYFRARVYLDEPHTATLFGPFEGRGTLRESIADQADRAVVAYLERRYATVRRR